MLNILFHLTLFFLFISSLRCSSNVVNCVSQVLDVTQSCSNRNKLYVTTMGTDSGFGSEFNAYLMNSMLTALLDNKRLIYFVSKRPWEYDCPGNQAWACYFTFAPCTDNVATSKDLDFSLQRNVFEPLKVSGQSFLDHNLMKTMSAREGNMLLGKMAEVLTAHGRNGSEICSGTSQPFQEALFAGVLTHKLFALNNITQRAVHDRNKHYFKHIGDRPYFALQLRLTDKQYETPEADWIKLSDMRYVAQTAHSLMARYHQQHLSSPPLRTLFIATDNCTAASEFVDHLLDLHKLDSDASTQSHGTSLHFLGACFDPPIVTSPSISSVSDSTARSYSSTPFVSEARKQWEVRSQSSPSTSIDVSSDLHERRARAWQVIADLQMLSQGALFAGSFYSNMVRLVHYLRIARAYGESSSNTKRSIDITAAIQATCNTSFHLLLDDPQFQHLDSFMDGF